jgi:demethylmacrocin O-methyltransferase
VRVIPNKLTEAAARKASRRSVAEPEASAEPDKAQQREERRRRLLASDLTELAVEFGTDKWGIHRYTPHYQRHLEHLRGEEFVLLELGVGGYKRKRRSGASLKMWKWFFPHARILGLDIEDKSFIDRDRIRTFMGDQTDPGILQRIIEEEGAPLVVIDDGSHIPQHVRDSFAILFPLLPDGAVYCIEDIQTSYWPAWGGQLDPKATGTSMDLVKDLIDGLNHEEFLVEGYQASYTDRHVKAVHCYHNLVVIEKGDNLEGSNKETASRSFHGGSELPEA